MDMLKNLLNVQNIWVGEPVESFVNANSEIKTKDGERVKNINELLDSVSTVIAKRVEDEDANA